MEVLALGLFYKKAVGAITFTVLSAALLLFCLPKIKVTKQKGTNIKTIGVA